MDWTVEYYRGERGKEPVADFIVSLPYETRAKVFRLTVYSTTWIFKED